MRAGIILTSGFWLLMITLRNLEKFFEAAYGCSYVLRRINLEIPRKRARYNHWPSGPGKSALRSILARSSTSNRRANHPVIP